MSEDVKVKLPDGTEVTMEEAEKLLDVEPTPPVEEPAEEPTEEPPAEPKTVPLAALQDERRKRKQAELAADRATQHSRELESLRRQHSPAVEDLKWGESEDFSQMGDKVTTYVDESMAVLKSGMSAEVARIRYEDYDEVIAKSGILNELRQDPVLAVYVARQPMPAFALYEIAKGRVGETAPSNPPADPKKTIRKVVENAEAPVTLSQAPAGPSAPPSEEVTLEKAVELTDDEWAKLPAATRERLLAQKV